MPFNKISKLKQTGAPEAYVLEFQRVAFMVSDISETLLVLIFTKWLVEPLNILVKA